MLSVSVPPLNHCKLMFKCQVFITEVLARMEIALGWGEGGDGGGGGLHVALVAFSHIQAFWGKLDKPFPAHGVFFFKVEISLCMTILLF